MNNMIQNLRWGPVDNSALPLAINLPSGKQVLIEKKDREITITIGDGSGSDDVHRFVCGPADTVFLEPMLPDHPVVIKPDTALSILPDKTLHAFIQVPLVMLISGGSAKRKHPMMEVSYSDLSRSWFGDPDSGEIAYFLESSFITESEKCRTDGSVICCPVSVSNRSNQLLTLERMILRVPLLSIYRGKERLYANKTKINFRGQDQISQISYGKSAPDLEPLLQPLSPPRSVEEGVLRKSFYFIRTLYNG